MREDRTGRAPDAPLRTEIRDGAVCADLRATAKRVRCFERELIEAALRQCGYGTGFRDQYGPPLPCFQQRPPKKPAPPKVPTRPKPTIRKHFTTGPDGRLYCIIRRTVYGRPKPPPKPKPPRVEDF